MCHRTGDAFLQAFIESTQADLVQQTGAESLEGLHIFQTCHNDVNVLPRALFWSGGIEAKRAVSRTQKKKISNCYLNRA